MKQYIEKDIIHPPKKYKSNKKSVDEKLHSTKKPSTSKKAK